MNAQLEQNLADALEAQADGQPIEQILARYPADAELLRPHLETAASLQELRIAHSLKAQAASRERFLAEAAALKNAGSVATWPAWFTLRRLLTNALALAVIVLVFGAGLVAAANQAGPGDAMYGAKLVIEDMRLSLASEPQAEALRFQFNQERIREINRLLADGEAAEVRFSGRIQSMDGDTWLVAGLPVQIGADTIIDGQPRVGAQTEIEGHTEDGQLFGERLEIRGRIEAPEIDPTEQEATPTPSLTPTPSPTSTATATPTPTETTTPTAIVTREAVPEAADDDAADDETDDDRDNDDDDDDSDNSGSGNSDDDDDNSGSGGGDGDDDDDDDDDDGGPGDDDDPDDD
ncbi:MAG: DUF5666 domain-containing protein [Candidatus Promineifilaceae bacterium]|nr:DUF5666 domain-containing protein [Candidatus Promineifilaceae bacterium]